MSVVYAPEAIEDLVAIADHIAKDSPPAASRFADRVMDMVEDLARGGLDGPEQELISGGTVRSWPVPPVRVYYRRTQGGLQVLRIYHQARRPIVR